MNVQMFKNILSKKPQVQVIFANKVKYNFKEAELKDNAPFSLKTHFLFVEIHLSSFV